MISLTEWERTVITTETGKEPEHETAPKNTDNEIYHFLVGEVKDGVWYTYVPDEYQIPTEGTPASVAFDPYAVLDWEETEGDVMGFYHTHPSFIACPSLRDHRTMRAWVAAFGRPLLCLIEGVNGLWAYLYLDDENMPVKLFKATRFRDDTFIVQERSPHKKSTIRAKNRGATHGK